jgi:hypothetical protein
MTKPVTNTKGGKDIQRDVDGRPITLPADPPILGKRPR